MRWSRRRLELARNAANLTDEKRVGTFGWNMNDGGFLSRDAVAHGKEVQCKWLVTDYKADGVINLL